MSSPELKVSTFASCVFLHEWINPISQRGQGSLHFLLKTMTHDWFSDGKYAAWWHYKQGRRALYHTPSIFHIKAAPCQSRNMWFDRQTVVQHHHCSGNDILKHWQESYKINMQEVHHLILYPTDHMIQTAWDLGHFIIRDSADYHPTCYVGHVS